MFKGSYISMKIRGN